MIKLTPKTLLISTLLTLCGGGVYANETATRFEAHMDFLASDLLLGRDTGSVGHEVASQYIATEFAKMGIKPAGNDGYEQRIQFKTAVLKTTTPQMTISNGKKEIEFEFMDFEF